MGKKKPIVTPFGQWAYPGEITVIPSNTITMKGVDYPVMGIDNLGNSELMLPGGEYTFPGDYVTEIPQMGKGGLTQWFAEEWTDIKTGKPCGRSGKEKGSRPYPACRPKKRVNETTPKTTSEMSSAEKAKFKREKTSGKRIDYNHKRREFGGQIGWLDSYQDGGLYAVGPYDEMIAPKQGNYLLPDINRPSYLDEFGGMRSEYKMGFNDNGKEVLIPTVVQGRQLTEDEAVDNYYRTGLHMGKYDTVQDAENASALRTAKYNMLQDPVRFDMTQYQKGGWLNKYQDAGEVSTEQNPESIGQVHVRAKDKGWFDNYIKRPLRKFGRSYAQRISDATGGSEWYKQANPFMNLAFESINAPQYAATYAVTGKVQTPSEAMNIQNPYGAFAVDAVLDPTNLLGAGLLKQPIKNLGRNIVSSPNNIGTAKLYDKALNLDSFLSEGVGELIAGRKNRKAISEGNTWLKNWIDDSITQAKIDTDLGWIPERNNILKDRFSLGYEQAKSFIPDSKEYPFSEQFKDLFVRNRPHIHADNSGVSYLHSRDPYARSIGKMFDDPRLKSSWISRNLFMSKPMRRSTTIHEGTHDWTSNFLLRESGQFNDIKNLYSDNIKEINNKWQSLRNQGINPSEVMGRENANLGYLADPTEVHARIMELRQLMKMTPEQSVMVTPEKAQGIIRSIENPKNAKFIDPKFLDVIDKDPKKLAALFNRLWAAPAATALGASQLQEKKYGGWLDSYQSGGEINWLEKYN